MYLRLIVAIAVVVAAAAFSPAPLPKTHRKPAVDDVVLLQGTYKVLEYGRPNLQARGGFGGPRRTNMKIRISGDKFAFLYQQGNDWMPSTTYEMKLNSKASPKTMDMSYNAGDYTVTLKGIYKIEGNKVTLLYNYAYSGRINQDAERPTNFGSPPMTAMQMVLERE
jgi:uncharacterized protein (TIGR03067 family)